MNGRMVLRRLDLERRTIADNCVTLETTPHVVRAISKIGSWNGIVYSSFAPPETEPVVNDEIRYFAKLHRNFEWKVYSHDKPSDLLARLRNRGFKVGDEESLMILDVQDLPPGLLAPAPEDIMNCLLTRAVLFDGRCSADKGDRIHACGSSYRAKYCTGSPSQAPLSRRPQIRAAP